MIMKCWNAKGRISAYLDDAMPPAERQAMRRHLSACRNCALESSEQQRFRKAVYSLPRRVPPSDLTLRLRVAASKVRAEVRGPGRWVRFRDRLSLALDNLMRPLALPAAGGLCSAVFLFSSLVPAFMPTYAMARTVSPWDPPTLLLTEPMVKYLAPIAFGGDAVVDVDVDDHGCIIGYSIVSSAGPNNAQLRRAIENNLLFTEFWPATAFGVPVSGTIRISYRSPAGIDVKG
jgi:hypothetical protein